MGPKKDIIGLLKEAIEKEGLILDYRLIEPKMLGSIMVE